jgi:trans-aconitate 2-methyltransferase
MTRDWNAERYHDVSTPQQAWGRRVLDRLSLAGTERALDLGCGTGHLTSLLAERLPRGRVTGLDRSATMVRTAASWLRDHAPGVALVLADGARLPFTRASFDIVFSNATFHWIHDHVALFGSIFDALEPGGRLLAQCGGGPNVERLHRRSERLMGQPRFASFFHDWTDPWYFADVATTERRLAAAGFVDIDVGLEEAPTRFGSAEEYEDFISTVCVRHHLSRLADADRSVFLSALTTEAGEDDPSFTLDYWRLNISARRPV